MMYSDQKYTFVTILIIINTFALEPKIMRKKKKTVETTDDVTDDWNISYIYLLTFRTMSKSKDNNLIEYLQQTVAIYNYVV